MEGGEEEQTSGAGRERGKGAGPVLPYEREASPEADKHIAAAAAREDEQLR